MRPSTLVASQAVPQTALEAGNVAHPGVGDEGDPRMGGAVLWAGLVVPVSRF